ncbi:reprolysin-like metallopeptidase [Candidatus Parabeggiatoa sp. HSG14]|uniref:reprolysin-like metallopeptidase n=1 Tax=Candidatus Parabeggiatoa sp. HSG14 TaxID=3055593 RepID=UPI0025A6B95A|nr:zinc-dependent metalloprotease family protein [Thiotrichales bacterium HSG14]
MKYTFKPNIFGNTFSNKYIATISPYYPIFLVLILLLSLIFPVQAVMRIPIHKIEGYNVESATLHSNTSKANQFCFKEEGNSQTIPKWILGNKPLFLNTLMYEEVELPNPTITRLRYTHINPYALSQQNNYTESAYTKRVILNLFPDISYTALNHSLHYRSMYDYTWIGKLENVQFGDVTLVVKGNKVTGNINANGEVYQIRSTENSLHAIQKMDPSSFPLVSHQVKKKPRQSLVKAQTSTHNHFSIPLKNQDKREIFVDDNGETVVIDMMVVYTTAAARSSNDIVSEIRLTIEETNMIYVNSGIRQKLRLIFTAQIDYTESGFHHTDLDKLTYTKGHKKDVNGELDEVHRLRDIHEADLVSLWVEKGDPRRCGMAWIPGQISVNSQKYGFSVIDRYCASAPSYSFAHELGHNMGATHDKYVVFRGKGKKLYGAYKHSYGYVHAAGDTANSWRTILASEQQCRDEGYHCPRIPYFSSPDIFYNAVAIGDNTTDNRLTLNNTAATIANYRELSSSRLKLVENLEKYYKPHDIGLVGFFFNSSQFE